jgi:hypothetical protein
MRFISRFYSVIMKDTMKFRFFLARLAGSTAPEPNWSEFDKPFLNEKKTTPVVEKPLDDPFAQDVTRDGKVYKVVTPGIKAEVQYGVN